MSFPKIYERFAKRPISMHEEDGSGKSKLEILNNRRRSSMSDFEMLFKGASFKTRKQKRVSMGGLQDADFGKLDKSDYEDVYEHVTEKEDGDDEQQVESTDQVNENVRPGIKARPETKKYIPSKAAIKAAAEAYHGPFPKPKSGGVNDWEMAQENFQEVIRAIHDDKDDDPEEISFTSTLDESYDYCELSPSSSFADLMRMTSNMTVESLRPSVDDPVDAYTEFDNRPPLKHVPTSSSINSRDLSLDLVRTVSSTLNSYATTSASPISSMLEGSSVVKARLFRKRGINAKGGPESELEPPVSPTVSVTSSNASSPDSDKSFGCVGMSTWQYSEMLAAGHQGFRNPKPDGEYPGLPDA